MTIQIAGSMIFEDTSNQYISNLSQKIPEIKKNQNKKKTCVQMSYISSERTSLSYIEQEEALVYFQKLDREKKNSITFNDCLQAIQLYARRDFSENEIEEIRQIISSARVTKIQYLQIIEQIHQLNQSKCTIKLGEKFLIDNFSKKEIKTFVNEWQKVDDNLQGHLSLQFTRIVIENVLQHYQDSNANDSDIKSLFIEKASSEKIFFEEYMNFISAFLKKKKYRFSSKKNNNVCACSIF
ncbi:hypothetical protein TTHERM_00521960 (macronuclear) [Tetrahymena thermophila SB210]|uniref:EF-hand domain-containing protein n=1 Tax=Tetrahymena thermophila (strain SB210) TaxID=312017 RepID=I7M7K6_TETTS|nr:hypothetical protein TTHERM_00521960 [Tetrahymena thermophila SB210]EAR94129.4 hypothetical protein TTHERM_00521960 [Tetrahymena thermophila SB210]|eukprot:XP_001014374.4 hypothetical protein TTHERM_00521960 [Tetrahymena thermophila SB210]